MYYKMTRFALILLTVVLVMAGCKKEKTTWSPNWKVPVLTGKIGLNDLLQDYSKENADGYASLIYNDTAYSFRVDTLIKLPDTSLVQKSAIAFSSVNLAPGAFISNEDIDQLYDLGDISLKRVIISEGQAFITISSPWPGKTKAVFEFPKVKDNFGNVFSQTYFLEAGTIADPFIIRDTFDITDYDFDLTGADGSLSNNLTANITMFSNEESNSFTITNLDTVLLSLSFSGLKPKYARGYFGQYDLSDTTTIQFSELEQISGLVDFDSLTMDLNIQNGFDLIAQAKLTSLVGKNAKTANSVALNFPFLGQFLNLNPASGGLYDFAPSDYHLAINSGNSNIIPFITNLPDSLLFGYEIKINPDGNLSAGTDQFFPNSRINLMADIELPLNIKLNQFTIQDTFDINTNDLDATLQNGQIDLAYDNSFPLDASLIIYLLDESGSKTDSLISKQKVESGTYDASINGTSASAKGIVSYTLSESQIDQLIQSDKIAISATFNTANLAFVKIRMTDFIDFKLTTDLNLKIEI